MITVYILLGILFVLIVIAIANIKIVPQAQVYVIERLGAYHTTWTTGLHVKIPFFDVVRSKVSLKERVVDFKPQAVITKDNVTMQIDTVVFFQVTDAKLFTYGVDNPITAIENLTATTLRNIIGDLELDHTLTSRDVINTKITTILDVASDKWGIKVNRVELKNIIPPKEIQDAMEKQMKAERERREAILQAEGKKNSQILVAQGEKEAQILKAQALKESQVLEAEAQKQALILHAQAVREQSIQEGEGKAKAIEIVQKATANGIRALNEAKPTEQVLTLNALDAFVKAADGKSTKIIIPSEIQSLAGLASSLKEVMSK